MGRGSSFVRLSGTCSSSKVDVLPRFVPVWDDVCGGGELSVIRWGKLSLTFFASPFRSLCIYHFALPLFYRVGWFCHCIKIYRCWRNDDRQILWFQIVRFLPVFLRSFGWVTRLEEENSAGGSNDFPAKMLQFPC